MRSHIGCRGVQGWKLLTSVGEGNECQRGLCSPSVVEEYKGGNSSHRLEKGMNASEDSAPRREGGL